jgi:hypothetical protein
VLADVIHSAPDTILSFLTRESKVGLFRQTTIQEKKGGGERIVYWQHFLKGGTKIVEYLLQMNVVKATPSLHTIEIKSANEQDISNEHLANLKDNLDLISYKKIQRGKFKGKLSVTKFEHGQSVVTIIGSLEARERAPQIKSDMRTMAWAESSDHSAADIKGDLSTAYASLKGILDTIAKQFSQPDIVDER